MSAGSSVGAALMHALWSTAPAQHCSWAHGHPCDHCESPAVAAAPTDLRDLKPHVQPPGGRGRGGGHKSQLSCPCVWRAGRQDSCIPACNPLHALQSRPVLMSSWWGGWGTDEDPRGPKLGLSITNRPLGTVTRERWQRIRLAHLRAAATWQPSCAGPQGSGRLPSGGSQLVALHAPLPPWGPSRACATPPRCSAERPWRPTFWSVCLCIALMRALHCSPGTRMACMPAERKRAPPPPVALQRQACTALCDHAQARQPASETRTVSAKVGSEAWPFPAELGRLR